VAEAFEQVSNAILARCARLRLSVRMGHVVCAQALLRRGRRSPLWEAEAGLSMHKSCLAEQAAYD